MSEPPSAPPPPPPPDDGGPYGQGPYGQDPSRQDPYGQGQYGQGQYGQGQYGQSPYVQAPYGQPYQPAGQTSTKAVVSLVLGIASFFVCGIFMSVPAIIVGRNAQREIDASGGRIAGRGLATAGFILGIVNAVLSVIVIVVVVIVIATGAGSSTGTGG